jgi:cytoskeletal protein CcmA (bactofilin family)
VDVRTTVIAVDTQWKGDITSEGSVHVHGRFEGSVRAKVAIFVAEGAEVDAALASDSIVVAGTSKGSIRAQSRFEVLPSGRVAGDIVSPTLVVHEGAVMAGSSACRRARRPPSGAGATPVVQRRAARGTA